MSGTAPRWAAWKASILGAVPSPSSPPLTCGGDRRPGEGGTHQRAGLPGDVQGPAGVNSQEARASHAGVGPKRSWEVGSGGEGPRRAGRGAERWQVSAVEVRSGEVRAGKVRVVEGRGARWALLTHSDRGARPQPCSPSCLAFGHVRGKRLDAQVPTSQRAREGARGADACALKAGERAGDPRPAVSGVWKASADPAPCSPSPRRPFPASPPGTEGPEPASQFTGKCLRSR